MNDREEDHDKEGMQNYSRRLSSIPESVWRGLMEQSAAPFHESDSLKIYQDECFRGYVPSRKEYFYGLKVHALMTESEIPVEIFLSPGSYSDVNAIYDFSFSVSSESVIYSDRTYNAYDIEDELGPSYIHLNSIRKKNSK